MAMLDISRNLGSKYHGFKIEVIDLDIKRDSVLVAGFGYYPYPSFRLPGWESLSLGYHSDDGRVYFSNRAEYIGPTIYKGDQIECIIQKLDADCGSSDGETCVIFKINGVALGHKVKCKLKSEFLYPTIGGFGHGQFKISFKV
jgi:hypothetical protein